VTHPIGAGSKSAGGGMFDPASAWATVSGVSSRHGGIGPAFVKPRSKLRKWLPLLLLLGAVACLVGAFFQFRLSQEVRQATVILVMDASNSMRETDIAPTRLNAAQDAAHRFVGSVPSDFKVGLVSFADAPKVEVPPTLDQSEIDSAIDSLTAEGTPGTVIGDGLVMALGSLRSEWNQSGAGPAAVLLLTDGLDSSSDIPPQDAASRAASLAIPVFTVRLGEHQVDPEGGPSNTEVLQQMADATGARSFEALSAEQLTQIYERIGSTLSTELAVTDIGLPFLIAAGALGLLAGVVLVTGTDSVDWR
jgi:Ca-activated chloride channel homolog